MSSNKKKSVGEWAMEQREKQVEEHKKQTEEQKKQDTEKQVYCGSHHTSHQKKSQTDFPVKPEDIFSTYSFRPY